MLREFTSVTLLFLLEECLSGYYGDGCKQTCICFNGASCKPTDGRCMCPPGFQGKFCEKGMSILFSLSVCLSLGLGKKFAAIFVKFAHYGADHIGGDLPNLWMPWIPLRIYIQCCLSLHVSLFSRFLWSVLCWDVSMWQQVSMRPTDRKLCQR